MAPPLNILTYKCCDPLYLRWPRSGIHTAPHFIDSVGADGQPRRISGRCTILVFRCFGLSERAKYSDGRWALSLVKRFLITTALESTWCENKPVLFLGEWCRRYSRKNHWSTLDSVVLPYHWDDRAQFHADYEYLKLFHERLLQDLTAQLNEIHGVDHSLRYWRILIGPWLGYFVQVLFDRWTSIQQAVSRYDLSGTAVLASQNGPLVPNDMDDFNQLYIEDAWNHEQYAYILQRFTEVPCIVRVQQAIDAGSDLRPTAIRWKQRVKQTLMAGGLTK